MKYFREIKLELTGENYCKKRLQFFRQINVFTKALLLKSWFHGNFWSRSRFYILYYISTAAAIQFFRQIKLYLSSLVKSYFHEIFAMKFQVPRLISNKQKNCWISKMWTMTMFFFQRSLAFLQDVPQFQIKIPPLF